jgi:hypothetical protein
MINQPSPPGQPVYQPLPSLPAAPRHDRKRFDAKTIVLIAVVAALVVGLGTWFIMSRVKDVQNVQKGMKILNDAKSGNQSQAEKDMPLDIEKIRGNYQQVNGDYHVDVVSQEYGQKDGVYLIRQWSNATAYYDAKDLLEGEGTLSGTTSAPTLTVKWHSGQTSKFNVKNPNSITNVILVDGNGVEYKD